MTQQIIFATGNSRKITEAIATLAPYNIDIDARVVDIDEIQNADPANICVAKAEAAYAATGHSVVVSDTSWSIPALGGFPGGYMKDVAIWWQASDWLNIMAAHSDKRIICMEHIAYCDGTATRHFVAEYEGRFIDEIRGRQGAGESFEQVVILYGNKTMAEQLGDGDIASAGEDLRHWKLFAEWFSAQCE